MWFRIVAVFCLALSLAGEGSAVDANRNLLGPLNKPLQMPGQGQNGSGFDAFVSITDQTASGYLPIKIELRAQGTFPADRNFTFQFRTRADGTFPPQNGMLVEVPIQVDQGSKSKSVIRSLPKWYAGQLLDVSVQEDGRRLPQYEGRVGNVNGPGTASTMWLLAREQSIATLNVLDEDAEPDIQIDLSELGLGSAGVNGLFGRGYLEHGLIQSTSWRELPTDWREFNRYDWVVIRKATLTKLQKEPDAFASLRSWLLLGGTLVIYGTEDPAAACKAAGFHWTNDQTAQLRVRSARRTQAASLSKQIDQWEDQLSAISASSIGLQATPNDLSQRVKALESKISIIKRKLFNGVIDERVWFQRTSAGNLFAVGTIPEKSAPSVLAWRIISQLTDFRASPSLRRGVDPLLGDARFSRWLIPGVAEPPVYTFIGLLTLFVVLVGPIAYRKTTKHGRGYLMFAIAPLLALFTTLAMFGYGIVADGFDTIVRVRQLTWVDGKTGDAGERVRATYFAGLRPKVPLTFSNDTEVMTYPMTQRKAWEELNMAGAETMGSVVVAEEQQLFDPAFLPSRQQRQFVSHLPRAGFGSLTLLPGEDGQPRLKSSLSISLRETIVRDSDGDYWSVPELPAGETKACQTIDEKAASKILGQLYSDHRPVSRVRDTRRRNVNRSFTYDVIANLSRDINVVNALTDGIFEFELQADLQTDSELKRDHFVATAEVSSDVLALEGCQLVESVRYVFGTLK